MKIEHFRCVQLRWLRKSFVLLYIYGMRITALIVAILLIAGCKKKVEFVYQVPQEFEPYVQKFIAEARTRGRDIVINNLIIQYDSSTSFPYCASSNVISSRNDVQKMITVNGHPCSQNSTQFETLIFHELGHCILGRDHDMSLLPRGDPKSIMYTGDLTMYSPCVYALADSCNKLYRRGYYIDELFNPSTSLPPWGR